MGLRMRCAMAAMALGGLFTVLPNEVAAQDPPSEVIFCARGSDSDISPLVGMPELEATLVGDKVTLEADVPSGATCVRISRMPSDRNPLVLEWNATGLGGPHSFVDHEFASSGTYCYELVVGSPDGRSEGIERCVEDPSSVAPTPTATPTLPATPAGPGVGGPDEKPTVVSPGAPDTGSAETPSNGSRHEHSVVIGFTLLVSAMLLALFFRAGRRPL